jgi:hypothetical protein
MWLRAAPGLTLPRCGYAPVGLPLRRILLDAIDQGEQIVDVHTVDDGSFIFHLGLDSHDSSPDTH